MSKTHQLPISRFFMKGHPQAGEPTYFIEKIWRCIRDQNVITTLDSLELESAYRSLVPCIFTDKERVCNHQPKHHTIREGKRYKTGDFVNLFAWAGKPYWSKHIKVANKVPLIRVADIEIDEGWETVIDGKGYSSVRIHQQLSHNDGLSFLEYVKWFRPSLPFSGQILIWSDAKLPY